MHSDPLPGKTRRCTVLSVPSMLSLKGIAAANAHLLMKHCFFVVVLWVSSMPVLLAFRAGCLGIPVFRWGPRCVVQTLHSSRTSWELGFFPRLYDAMPGVEFLARVHLSLSYPLQCIFSFPHCIGVPRRGLLHMYTYVISVGKEKFWNLLCCYIGWLPNCFPFYSISQNSFSNTKQCKG